MAIQETNFLEIVLREIMIGRTIYEDLEDGSGKKAIVINNLNYDPIINHVYICDMIDTDHPDANMYKMSIRDNFDFDYDVIKKIKPNRKKIKGKRKR